jgi:nucleoid-associated protein YgaU
MGLFSFLKNAGAKIFGYAKPAENVAATAPSVNTDAQLKADRESRLVAVVNQLGLNVGDISCEMITDDTVAIYGTADTQADKEKVVLAVGNIEGIAVVDDRMSVTNPEPEAQFYTVKSGDSLSKIAKEFYGNAMKYPVIFEANKPMLKDVDLIYPGQVLRIPNL